MELVLLARGKHLKFIALYFRHPQPTSKNILFLFLIAKLKNIKKNLILKCRDSYRDYHFVMKPARGGTRSKDKALKDKQPISDDQEKSNENKPGPSRSRARKKSSSDELSTTDSSDSDEAPKPKVRVDPGIDDPR